jgi:osmoprotectant transport system ATP-binding protein
VDATGALTGVSSRDDIHAHAGRAHTEAQAAVPAASPATTPVTAEAQVEA